MDTAPSRVPVHTALKIPHQLISNTMNCNCGPPQFACDPECCTPTGMSTTWLKNCTSCAVPKIPGRLGSQRISQRAQLWDHNCVLQYLRLRNLHDPNNKDIDHLLEALQVRNLCGLPNKLDRRDHPQRHNRDVDDFRRTATAEQPQFFAHVHNLVQELHELQASALSGPWFLSLQTGNCTTLSKNCTTTPVFCTVWTIRHLSLNQDVHGRDSRKYYGNHHTKEAFLVLHEDSCVSHCCRHCKTIRVNRLPSQSRKCVKYVPKTSGSESPLLWGQTARPISPSSLPPHEECGGGSSPKTKNSATRGQTGP